MAKKVTTCGVLVMNRQRELLLGHATGAKHWDIFKGVGDPGETAIETAVRETSEESGLSLDLAVLSEIGLYPYLPAKDLHLFATLIERIDPASCVCRSMFEDARGRMRPEMDAFEWTPFERVPERCARSMTTVLAGPVSLDEVLVRLVDSKADEA